MKKKNNIKVNELKARLTGILPEVEKASPSVATQVKVVLEDKTVSETTLNDVLNLATEALAKASEKQETKKEAKNTEKQKFEDHFKSINDCKKFLAELTSNPVATISPDLLNEVQEATMLADEELNLDDMVALCKKVAIEVTKPEKPSGKQKPKAKTSENSTKKPKGLSKKTTKKSTTTENSPKVKSEPQIVPTLPPVAVMFPETLKISENFAEEKTDGNTDFVLVPFDKLVSYEEFMDFLKKYNEVGIDVPVICASYWTAYHLAVYCYAYTRDVEFPKNFKGFPNDLDISVPLTNTESMKRIWFESIYTGALHNIQGDFYKPITVKNPATGNEFTVRCYNNCDFAFYVPANLPTDEEIKKMASIS